MGMAGGRGVGGAWSRARGERPSLLWVTPRPSLSQGVHESRGVTKDYLRLEALVQKVVSPYLGTYGLYSSEGSFTHSCILGRGCQGLGRAQVTAGLLHLCPGPGRVPGPGHSEMGHLG